MENFKDKKVLITGGTGSFGNAFVNMLLETQVKKIYIFSRDELKQSEMKKKFNDDRLQFFVGDIRDKYRLYRAFDGINYIVHAAAQKHVPSCEYNPFEAVKTNILGAQNIIEAAIDKRVEKVIALSTDKAVNPHNLYGMTKGCMEKLFISGNAYSGDRHTKFSIVRYGNVINSRGSVIPLWKKYIANGEKLPLTDLRMTRFWITLEQAVDFVRNMFLTMDGGEIFIPDLPSMKITDLAEAMKQDVKFNVIGIRQGEKLHETLISNEELTQTLSFGGYYIIYPDFDWLQTKKCKYGYKLPKNFVYSSDKNDKWIKVSEMRELLK
jgi:UDP-N-acetylglucosamine 4,6-dehydratase